MFEGVNTNKQNVNSRCIDDTTFRSHFPFFISRHLSIQQIGSITKLYQVPTSHN